MSCVSAICPRAARKACYSGVACGSDDYVGNKPGVRYWVIVACGRERTVHVCPPSVERLIVPSCNAA